MSCIKSCTFPENPWVNRRPLTKSRHLTCVAGNYLSLGPSSRRRGNYSSELSGRSELPFGRRQTVQRAGGLPRRSSPGPPGPLTCRCRKIGAHDALPSRRRFCVFWESAVQAKQPPPTVRDLSEQEIDLLAKMAHEQYGLATVETLNQLLRDLGF